jgi:hypothetical protein
MSLKQLFRNIHNTYCINKNPQTKIKRLLESYNSNDWHDKIKHQRMYNINPVIHNGLEIEKRYNYTKTPVFLHDSPYFDMFIIGFPKLYRTNIHDHTHKDCFFKVLEGEVIEKRYNLSKLSHSNILYNGAPVPTIGHVKSNEFHAIKNTLEVPTYTLNIYSK